MCACARDHMKCNKFLSVMIMKVALLNFKLVDVCTFLFVNVYRNLLIKFNNIYMM